MNYVEFLKCSMKFRGFASCEPQVAPKRYGVEKYGADGFSSDLFVFSGLVTKVVGGGVARGWLPPRLRAFPCMRTLGGQEDAELFCCFTSMRRTVPVLLFCYKFV